MKSIDHLFNVGEFRETLTMIDNNLRELSPKSETEDAKHQIPNLLLMRVKTLIRMESYSDAKNNLAELMQWTENNKDPYLLVDILLVTAEITARTGNFTAAKQQLQTIQFRLDQICAQDPSINPECQEIISRRASFAFVSSINDWHHGNLESALNYIQVANELRKKQGQTYEIAETLATLGMMQFDLGNFEHGIENLDTALTMNEEIGNKSAIATILNNLGWVYKLQGDLDHSLSFIQQSMAIRRKIATEESTRIQLANIGVIFRQKGDFPQAISYLERALVLAEKVGNITEISLIIYWLIFVQLDLNLIDQAQSNLQRLSQLYEQSGNNKIIEQRFQIASALLIKKNPRAKSIYLAEEMMKKIAMEANVKHDLLIDVLLILCDFLLIELRLTNSTEILTEINQTISRLSEITEDMHSYLLWAEIDYLRAKVALLQSDIKTARKLLSQAQTVAENQGLTQLAQRISFEHDQILEEQEMWENLAAEDSLLQKRAEKSGISTHIDRLLRQGVVEVPTLSEAEIPVLLIILNEDGPTIFTRYFTETWKLNDQELNGQLVGGLLAAFNVFSSKLFTEALDRAKFGEFNIVLKAISPFLFCYVFKAQHSYAAQLKLKQFVGELQNDSALWDHLLTAIPHQNVLDPASIPILDTKCKDVFLNTPITTETKS